MQVSTFRIRQRYRWEPVPLPDPATTELHERAESHDWRFWLVTAVYLLCLGAIAAVPRTKELPAN